MRLPIASLLLVLASFLPAAPDTLRFGVNPTESALNLRKEYEPLRAALANALGLKVELFFAPDYTSVIEAMRFSQIDICHLGNNAAIDLVDRAGGEVFVQTVDADGLPGYWPLIVVHHSSPLSSLDDLIARRRELTLAMGDPQSTSGTLIPGYYAFAANGVNPQREFKALRSSNHEANLLSVATRKVDAATANSEALSRLERSQPRLAAQLRVVWKGPLIASDPLMLRSDLPDELKERIVSFFISFGRTPEERAALAPLRWSGFRLSSNEQLRPYRLLRLERERALIEADARLPAREKAERLASISARRAVLETKSEGTATSLAP